jgi:subtilisin family serine protease
MFRTRYYLVAFSLWFSLSSASAQTEVITIGKHRAHPTRILAKYRNNDQISVQSSLSLLKSVGVTVKDRYGLVPGLVLLDSETPIAVQAVSVTAEAKAQKLMDRIVALQESGHFEYVQPSYVYTHMLSPEDTRFMDDTLWGLSNRGRDGGLLGADIDVLRAWDLTTGSTNIIVAVIDSGIRYTHSDLAAQMWRNPREVRNGLDDDADGYVDNIFGINAFDDTGDPMDDNGHGTHVAGTIGAAANDGNPLVGVAWKVQLMACKFLGREGFGFTDGAIKCIDFAVNKGAHILNNSWGGGPFERALFDSIAAAQAGGVLFVAAAGNEASDNDSTAAYPASYALDNIISVAAIDRADRVADFSNYGQRSVHVAAPGVQIFSATERSDSSYGFSSGTSMAAPHVSGVAALVRAHFPEVLLPELRERIVSTAIPTPNLGRRVSSNGRVSAYRALTASPDGIMEMSVYPPPGNELLADTIISMFVTVTDMEAVTNATVIARIPGVRDPINFRNDGSPPDAVAEDATYSAEVRLPDIRGELEITFTITAEGKTDLTETVVYHLVGRPINDNFEKATKVPSTGGFMLATNRFATMQLGEPRHAKVPSVAGSLWWNWSPARSGNVIVDTAGSSFDTVLAVYTNNSLMNLKEVASVDDVGPRNSRLQGYVQFNAIAGTTYRIAVAGYSQNDVGVVRLRIEYDGQPDTTAPTVIITSPVSGLVITEPPARIVVSGTASDSQPNASGVKEVLVQVNSGLSSPAFGTTNWASTNLLQEGLNYIRVRAADFAGNVSDARVVMVNYQPRAAANDHFNNAIELLGLSGTVSGDSGAATKEFGEPFHAGNEGGKSLWWYFRAPSDGSLSLSTVDSDFDTLLAVYTGTRVNQLSLVASNDDAFEGASYSDLNIGLRNGEVCMIVVDGFGGSFGSASIDYTFTPVTVYSVTIALSEDGVVSPGSGLYAADSELVLRATPNAHRQFDRWEGSVNSTDNPLAITVTRDMNIVPRFRPADFADGFESGSFGFLEWRTSGNAPWFVQSQVVSAGQFAAQSGLIGDGQSSSLFLDATLPAGTIAFDIKVSSEQNWDFLEFYLNSKLIERWSGDKGWLTFRFDVVSGTHKMEWRYSKDVISTSVGLDAAFLDNIQLPSNNSSGSGATARIGVQRLQGGGVQLVLEGGQKDKTYTIQVSNDLVGWQTLSTVTAAGSVTLFEDPARGRNARFYRIAAP